MKKYLLTLALALFGFVGAFASALDITENDGEYSPSGTTLDSDIELTSSNITSFNCENDWCILSIYDSSSNEVCEIGKGSDDLVVYGESCSLSAGDYTFGYSEGVPFNSISINFGGGSGGDNSGGSLLPNGESDLSSIITGLNSTITEFIPYLVYLGLGIITVIIGFVAIRWLVNRTQAKIRGTFSSGRRRR